VGHSNSALAAGKPASVVADTLQAGRAGHPGMQVPTSDPLCLVIIACRPTHSSGRRFPVVEHSVAERHVGAATDCFLGSVARSSLYTVGKRAFPVSGATVWNDLPLHVASAPSLAVFRQRLTTFQFPVPTRTLYNVTHVSLLPFITITTVWTPVVLAIINIISATLKMFMMIMMMNRLQSFLPPISCSVHRSRNDMSFRTL